MATGSNERIYVLGATGNAGSVVVDELIKGGAQVTAYTRSPQKIQSANVSIVEGGFEDLTPFKESINGHTRLFLLVPDMEGMSDIKIDICKKAYGSGVEQIVDLSVQSTPWRHLSFLLPHQDAERAIYSLERPKSSFVSLRPSNFMSNLLFSLETIKKQNAIVDAAGGDERQEWISPRDIGTVAARVLLDPIGKHGDAGYELVGEIITPKERAAVFSKILGRPITYVQVEPQEYYQSMIKLGMSHEMAYCMVNYQNPSPVVTRGLSVLLGRKPDSVESWIVNNKKAFT
ncbi:hypothetical protein BJV82DRAFT_509849 [Fennellomyces sp. T-0311]|nr:hypothetical protein BJV82DRAFT_509849 [Fennellomyces sp. T-0311]